MSETSLKIEWQSSGEPRPLQKLTLLQSLGFAALPANTFGPEENQDVDLSQPLLELPIGPNTSLNLSNLLRIMQVLVLSDLELAFLPPEGDGERDDPTIHWLETVLHSLWPSSARRALLAAQRALSKQGSFHGSLAELSLAVQTVLNEYCCPEAAVCGSSAGTSTTPVSAAGTHAALPSASSSSSSSFSAAAAASASSPAGASISTSGPSSIFVHAALRSSELDGRGRGVTTSRAIPAGEEIFRIPRSAVLNVHSALTSRTFGPIARHLLLNQIHADTVAMVFAIAERRVAQAQVGTAGPQAPWAEALLMAPGLEEEQHLFTWPLEALESLGSEDLVARVREGHASLWGICAALEEVAKSMPPQVAAAYGGVTFDDLLWARCLFDSRAVELSVPPPSELACPSSEPLPPGLAALPAGSRWLLLQQPDQPASSSSSSSVVHVECPLRIASLAPAVELLNHSTHGALAAPNFDAERELLVISTAAAQNQPGGEICLCYGALQTWEFLLYYGFCPRDNPHDRLTISLSIPEEDPIHDAKQIVFQLHGIPVDHALRPAAAAKCSPWKDANDMDVDPRPGDWSVLGILSPQLFRALRVLVIEDLEAIGQIDVDAPPGSDGMLSLDLACLEAAGGLLAGLLESCEPIGEDKDAKPIWWKDYGQAIDNFRANQRELILANIEAVRAAKACLAKAAAVRT